MNSQQVTAAMASKADLEAKAKQAENAVPLDLSVGMDEKYLPVVKGEPDKVNVSEGAYGTRKQYVYHRSKGNDYVYTDNGKVTSWRTVE